MNFSTDNQFILSGSHDNTIKLWNILTGECIRTLTGHIDYVVSVNFSTDNQFILSGSWDNTIKLWNT